MFDCRSSILTILLSSGSSATPRLATGETERLTLRAGPGCGCAARARCSFLSGTTGAGCALGNGAGAIAGGAADIGDGAGAATGGGKSPIAGGGGTGAGGEPSGATGGG